MDDHEAIRVKESSRRMPKAKIDCITVAELYDFACTAVDRLRPGDVVPISKSRARAWAQNPCADPHDIALIVASVDGRCVGYLGLVPGLVKIDHEFERVHYTSTLFVAQEMRGLGTAASLFGKAIELNCSMAGVAPSQQAAPLFSAMGFQKIERLQYQRYDLTRFNLLGLPLRAMRKLLRACGVEAPILEKGIRFGNDLTKAAFYAVLCSEESKASPLWTHRLTGVDDPAFERVQDTECPVRFYRNADCINWMLRWHWVSTDVSAILNGYYFDDYREQFEYEVLKPPGGGFVVIGFRSRRGERELRVLDYYFEDCADRSRLMRLALQRARAFKADCVVLPDACKAEISSFWLTRRLFKTVRKDTYVRPHSVDCRLAQRLDRLCLHYYDTDIPFT